VNIHVITCHLCKRRVGYVAEQAYVPRAVCLECVYSGRWAKSLLPERFPVNTHDGHPQLGGPR